VLLSISSVCLGEHSRVGGCLAFPPAPSAPRRQPSPACSLPALRPLRLLAHSGAWKPPARCLHNSPGAAGAAISLANPPCPPPKPPLAQQRGFASLKGRAGSGGVVPVSPSAPGTQVGCVGRGSCQPHLQTSPCPSLVPRHSCDAPTVPLRVGGWWGCHGWAGGVSSDPLSQRCSLPAFGTTPP